MEIGSKLSPSTVINLSTGNKICVDGDGKSGIKCTEGINKI